MKRILQTPMGRLMAQMTINSSMAMGLGVWGATQPWLAFGSALLAAAATLWLWWGPQAARTMGAALVVGYGWEIYAVYFGLYTYAAPQVLGVPWFVGPMWAVVAMFAIAIYDNFKPQAPTPEK